MWVQKHKTLLQSSHRDLKELVFSKTLLQETQFIHSGFCTASVTALRYLNEDVSVVLNLPDKLYFHSLFIAP